MSIPFVAASVLTSSWGYALKLRGQPAAGVGASMASFIPTAPKRLPVINRCHFIHDGRARRNTAIAPAASTIAPFTTKLMVI
jgi:hypothetical protein